MRHSFEVRGAAPEDVDRIAEAHLDSIRSLGPRYYSSEIVDAWGAHIDGQLYLRAMAAGQEFFIAVSERDGAPDVLGFSCHSVGDEVHGVAVYVRGRAARQGVGSALLRSAETAAIAAGAALVEIDASLAARDFYLAHGFEEIGRGVHRLPSGPTMPCVFMRKDLRPDSR